MNKNPSLYFLRFYLSCVVIFLHWHGVLTENSFFKNIVRPFSDSGLALDVFFVLSGYFITSDLMLSKKNESVNLTFKNKIAIFYIKRIFRIFPVYFLLLAILFTLNWPEIRPNIFYYVFFNANYLIYKNAIWNNLSHIWSLSIEEQFYLIWPFIILLVPFKKLLPTLIVLTTISVSYYFYSLHLNYWLSILLPSCFFALCVGGILAIIKISYPVCLQSVIFSCLLFSILAIKFIYKSQFFNFAL